MDITSYLLGKKAGGGGGQPSLQNKSITITENGTETVTYDSGYDGLRNVSITTNVSGGRDWSAIGYSEEPSSIGSFYNYSKNIYDNWDATQTSLYQKFYQDKDLVIMPLVDTSAATDTMAMFQTCSQLIDVPLLDTSNVTDMSSMFQNCSKLESVPLLDTSKVLNIGNMFRDCTNLKNVPLFNTSKVKGFSSFQNTFSSCPNLTDASLDNILQMCINATLYTSTKTLARLGFIANSYPISRIEALPHYQDFIDAGWTIGY